MQSQIAYIKTAGVKASAVFLLNSLKTNQNLKKSLIF